MSRVGDTLAARTAPARQPRQDVAVARRRRPLTFAEASAGEALTTAPDRVAPPRLGSCPLDRRQSASRAGADAAIAALAALLGIGEK